jgi:hypothetical protein
MDGVTKFLSYLRVLWFPYRKLERNLCVRVVTYLRTLSLSL